MSTFSKQESLVFLVVDLLSSFLSAFVIVRSPSCSCLVLSNPPPPRQQARNVNMVQDGVRENANVTRGGAHNSEEGTHSTTRKRKSLHRCYSEKEPMAAAFTECTHLPPDQCLDNAWSFLVGSRICGLVAIITVITGVGGVSTGARCLGHD